MDSFPPRIFGAVRLTKITSLQGRSKYSSLKSYFSLGSMLAQQKGCGRSTRTVLSVHRRRSSRALEAPIVVWAPMTVGFSPRVPFARRSGVS